MKELSTILIIFLSSSIAFDVQISFSPYSANPLNTKLFGHNLQWTNLADRLYNDPYTADFNGNITLNAPIYASVASLNPSVIRYPGGSFADVYYWQYGMGPLADRGSCVTDLDNTTQRVAVGTQEFLELCEMLNSEPLITANIVTERPEITAAWVNTTNIQRLVSRNTGKMLPKVTYWEVGNEPYLVESLINNPTFADWANYSIEAIKAMRAVDPTIKLGLPMKYNIGATGLPWFGYDYISNTLPQIHSQVDFDFIALHNAYLPFPVTQTSDSDFYYACMGSFKSVDSDIDLTLSQVKNITGKTYPIAITEFAALSPVDFWKTTSFTSALYAADMLHYFTTRSDIFMANYWSIVGNSVFGTVWSGTTPTPRPVYFVFEEYSRIFAEYSGDILLSVPMTMNSNHSLSTPEVGFVAATTNISAITGLAITTTTGDSVYLFLLNKDLNASAEISLNIPDFGEYDSLTVITKEFYSENVMVQWTFYDDPGNAAGLNWTLPVTRNVPFGAVPVTMKPHSLMSIKVIFNKSATTSGVTTNGVTTNGNTSGSTTSDMTTSGSPKFSFEILLMSILCLVLCHL